MGGKKHWSMNIYFTEVFVSWAELSWTHVPTFFFVYTHTSEKTPTNGLSKDSDHDNNHGSLIPQRRCWRVNILLCGLESSHSSPGCTPLLYILYIGYFFGAEIRMEVLYPRWNFGFSTCFFFSSSSRTRTQRLNARRAVPLLVVDDLQKHHLITQLITILLSPEISPQCTAAYTIIFLMGQSHITDG